MPGRIAQALGRKEAVVVPLTKAQIEAASQFADATVDGIKTDLGVHAETAVAAAARMAGTFLFRSFGFALGDVQPGQAVFSDKGNEQGPVLVSIMGAILTQLGISPGEKTHGDESPSQLRPNQDFLSTQRSLEPNFLSIAEQHGLSGQSAAYAAAAATAILIQRASKVLDPREAFDIAVYGFIEGTKTAPDPVSL